MNWKRNRTRMLILLMIVPAVAIAGSLEIKYELLNPKRVMTMIVHRDGPNGTNYIATLYSNKYVVISEFRKSLFFSTKDVNYQHSNPLGRIKLTSSDYREILKIIHKVKHSEPFKDTILSGGTLGYGIFIDDKVYFYSRFVVGLTENSSVLELVDKMYKIYDFNKYVPPQ